MSSWPQRLCILTRAVIVFVISIACIVLVVVCYCCCLYIVLVLTKICRWKMIKLTVLAMLLRFTHLEKDASE